MGGWRVRAWGHLQIHGQDLERDVIIIQFVVAPADGEALSASSRCAVAGAANETPPRERRQQQQQQQQH